jgi:hypothetical protein
MGHPVYGVVVHIAEGTYDGTISWQKIPTADVSSYFVNAKDGRRAQVVDTVDKAWTQVSGNSHWRGIEHEGYSGAPLTAAQCESLAREIAWLHQLDGFPLRMCTQDPRTVASQADGGVTWHAAGGDEWGGHYDCPGAPIIAQLPGVVARAQQIVRPVKIGDTMYALIQQAGDSQVWLADGTTRRPVAGKQLADVKYLASIGFYQLVAPPAGTTVVGGVWQVEDLDAFGVAAGAVSLTDAQVAAVAAQLGQPLTDCLRWAQDLHERIIAVGRALGD